MPERRGADKIYRRALARLSKAVGRTVQASDRGFLLDGAA